MKKNHETIERGKKLKELRAQTGLSQEKLGSLLEITGAAWRQYELGVRTPSDKIKKRIAVHFSKTVDELFF
jgi:DNA-binding XRE family transcriptional regulator